MNQDLYSGKNKRGRYNSTFLIQKIEVRYVFSEVIINSTD